MSIHAEFAACRTTLLAALSAEMDKRSKATGMDWVHEERYAITKAANDWARAHLLREVTVDDVERVEGLAVGHVDYARKLALYVAELVYGHRTLVSTDGER